MSSLRDLMLAPPPLTLAVAESLTSGHLQARIGVIPGASHFFRGGVTAYSLDAKNRLLGVAPALAEPVNGVSAEVAAAMARGAAQLFNTDLALATTGYAEPSSAHDAPHPFAWYALVDRRAAGGENVVRTERIDCPGLDRVAVQQRIADAALASLVAYLRGLRGV
jgi:competence/damage-inducible protein CinA C-terminal domain